MADINSGFWINWEHGAIQGATLTLPTYHGLVLVSFLTLFVQFSGGCFWRALCFVLHQIRSTTAARDGLHHQQQIILRNAITAPNALWSLGRSAAVWKNRVATPLGRSLPLLLITILHISCFAAAGLLSSQIASTRAGQALVHSTACGYPKQLPSIRNVYSKNLTGDDLDIFNAQVSLGRSLITKSTAYVRLCYNSDANKQDDCKHFVRQNLMGSQSSADMHAACPFGNNACITDAVRFDSGLVDSNKDVGLNSPPKDSLWFRRVTTCAPIRADRYATAWQENKTMTELYGKQGITKAKFYEFGKGDFGCEATPPKETTNLTTFCINQWMKDYLPQAYNVIATTAYAESPNTSDFKPIPDFRIANADVTLVSIFNKARYNGKVDDALFNAQVLSEEGSQWFTPTTDLDVLGCTEQYQFCNPVTQKCTDLTGLYAIQHAIDRDDLSLSTQQKATFSVMWQAGWAMALQWTARILGDRMLLAQEWLFTSTSMGSSWLPSNQWQLEAFNLHNLSLAIFQHRINKHASPETFEFRPGMNAINQIDRPTDPAVLALCDRQRILSARHYSVSVLGMVIILCIGSFLILLDQSIEKIWAQFFTLQWQVAKREEWTQTGTLQLHRQALEARGIGTWDRTNRDFPVLEVQGKTFAGLGVHGQEIGRASEQKSGYQVVTNDIPLHDQMAKMP